ncbi:MAG: phosphoribosylaminoimidazolesuccinocarboxamide synthase [bacterium]
MKKLIHQGSVKDIYELGEGQIEFSFSDRISVFDKPIPSLIPHKAETLCRTAVHWFEIAEKSGIATHFIDQTSPTSIRVKQVDIIPDYDKLNSRTTNYLIPLEFISRYYLAGSLFDRFKKGTLSEDDLGFQTGHAPRYGEKLPQSYLEMSTKLEQVDTLLSEEKALEISGLTPDELKKIKETILKLDEKINRGVEKGGLIRADGKKEFGFDHQRRLMLVDVFGTADEDRFWDMDKYKEGQCVELSKEFVRQYYRRIGYKDALYEARDRGEPEPDIPPLPAEVIKDVSRIYIELYERITGQIF